MIAAATTLNYAPSLDVGISTSSPRKWGNTPTTSVYFEPTGFADHLEKLRAVVADPLLWPEGAEAPAHQAEEWALAMLRQLQSDEFPPTRIVASAEGGVAICFVNADKYADVEFLNTGEILGVVSDRRNRPMAWEIGPGSRDFAGTSVRIREFIEAPPAKKNASRWPWNRWRLWSTT